MKNCEIALIYTLDDDSTIEIKEGMTVYFKQKHRLRLHPLSAEGNYADGFRKARVSKITSHKIFLDVSTENNSHVLSFTHDCIGDIRL